jgi:hypothetical protein
MDAARHSPAAGRDGNPEVVAEPLVPAFTGVTEDGMGVLIYGAAVPFNSGMTLTGGEEVVGYGLGLVFFELNAESF